MIMHTMQTRKRLIGLAALAILCAPVVAPAQEFPNPEGKTIGYLIDSRGQVVRNSYRECWRTGYWTPAMAIVECDPDLVKKPEPKRAALPQQEEKPPVPPPVSRPQPERVTFSADLLFDFDKAVLKPEGKMAMDDFAAKLKAVQYEVIIAAGHTDRIGSDAYNMKLSQRRAAAVKDYLVKEKGIAPEKVFVEGKGESDPVTHPGDCKGMGRENRHNAKLIACLQPDRRVDVDVAGTREVGESQEGK